MKILLLAIDVLAQGERWFKQHDFQGNYSEFLMPGFEKLDWKMVSM